jgi:hypothetical protein
VCRRGRRDARVVGNPRGPDIARGVVNSPLRTLFSERVGCDGVHKTVLLDRNTGAFWLQGKRRELGGRGHAFAMGAFSVAAAAARAKDGSRGSQFPMEQSTPVEPTPATRIKRSEGPRSIWTPRRVREVGAQFPDRLRLGFPLPT